MSPDRKRPRTDDYSFTETRSIAADVRSRRSAFLQSLGRGVSPPAGRESPSLSNGADPQPPLRSILETKTTTTFVMNEDSNFKNARISSPRIVPSPFKLTRIRDLPAIANVDTISIREILGDVMLKEVWLFDFLYDVDWMMQQFDPDIRPFVSVVLVHGSWRKEDSNKIHIDEASKRYPNVKVVTAYISDRYGCHHSKCMVLLRHDDLAQVIVHTANMIEQDWRNLSQGVWLSPLLPMHAHAVRKGIGDSHPAIGSGARFKQDFMAYLKHYGNRTTSLVSQLDKYDFSAIRAALIAHVPAKMDGKELEADAQLWGWPALKRALSNIQPSTSIRQKAVPHIVCQVSSIATLTEKWIRETLFSTLIQTANLSPLESASKKQKPQSPTQNEAKFSIIFPTPSEIRNSLDGYASGASIHCKLQNVSQRKQFEIMKPHLCHWHPSIPSIPTITSANSGSSPSTPSTQIATTRKALRGPAAPHIKTFIRFHNNSTHDSIDWALLTSANLSTQAWGTGAAAAKTGNGNDGEVRISSYELGVLVWPDLFLDDHEANSEEIGRSEKKKGEAKMIPTFGSDTPSDRQVAEAMSSRRTTAAYKTTIANRTDPEPDSDTASISTSNPDSDPEDVIIGLRMPYDLPLTPYGPNDEVWSARSSYVEPDRWGRVWNG